MDQNNNVGVASAVNFCVAPSGPSPDGGTWVGLGTTVPIERFGQTISGFAINQLYKLEWYQGNFGVQVLCQVFGNGQNAIQALVNSNVVGSGTVVAPSSAWTNESVMFVATSGTMTIEFELANQSSTGYLSIDGIRLSEVVPTPICFGNTGCPCNNNSAPVDQSGCLNSTGMGAKLIGVGGTSVSGGPTHPNDSLVLILSNLPGNPGVAIFFQSSAVGAPFTHGDGVRCWTGPLKRFPKISPIPPGSGSAFYPGSGQPKVSLVEPVPAVGGTRYYQAVYRQPPAVSPCFPNSLGINVSNGLSVIWTP